MGKLENITDHYFLHQNSEKSENLELENIKLLAFILQQHMCQMRRIKNKSLWNTNNVFDGTQCVFNILNINTHI